MCRGLIITVDHGSPGSTARLLASLKRTQGKMALSFLVVRNGSNLRDSDRTSCTPESTEKLWVLESARNRGYFGGVKQGLEWFQETQGNLPEWIIICNNDIRIEQDDFFERLSQLNSLGTGVIAPKIISSRTGLNQNPFMVRRLGRWRLNELRFWLKSYYLAFAHEKMSAWKHAGMSLKCRFFHSSREGRSDPPKPIYAPHGAFLIFSKEFFRRGGFVDDRSFLYHEEISVAEICSKIGLPILYFPELCVLHDEHSSTGRRFTRALYERQKESLQHLTASYLGDLVRP